MTDPNKATYCEICGEPGGLICADGWCCCAQHVATPKPERRSFWWRTGEPLNERGVAPSMTGLEPRSKYGFQRSFCEVCGATGPSVSIEGWATCTEHFRAPKPESPVFDWRTGNRLGPRGESSDDGR